MKSIKEKSEEYGKNWYQRKRIFSDKCRGCYAHVISSYEAGANYVLDAIEEAANICFDEEIKRVIEQLKKK